MGCPICQTGLCRRKGSAVPAVVLSVIAGFRTVAVVSSPIGSRSVGPAFSGLEAGRVSLILVRAGFIPGIGVLHGSAYAEFTNVGVGGNECRYEDTDSYQITEMFINNREQILRRLLG